MKRPGHMLIRARFMLPMGGDFEPRIRKMHKLVDAVKPGDRNEMMMNAVERTLLGELDLVRTVEMVDLADGLLVRRDDERAAKAVGHVADREVGLGGVDRNAVIQRRTALCAVGIVANQHDGCGRRVQIGNLNAGCVSRKLRVLRQREVSHVEIDQVVDGIGDFDDDNRAGICLLYTSDAADDLLCVDLGGRRIIKKKKSKYCLFLLKLYSKIYHLP